MFLVLWSLGLNTARPLTIFDNKCQLIHNKLIFFFKKPVHSVDGNSLAIDSVSRRHIGAYFCIASNGVPPSISKRIELRVQCKLIILDQLLRTPLGTLAFYYI